ncbi:hypothetical protein BV394_12920 [Brevirhabdus pacifica]|uniref:N-acetyltransferase domain-containing protein n=1 Tax=Brevirhabdus pacifica TaxID=1267768 RepID=A0A1U7DMB9_9RHOB|nr:hypothetical protein BV394_12920 [Brevirhabdus pacifica]
MDRADLDDPGVRALRQASVALMDRLFAPESNHYLDEDQQRAKGVLMFAAREIGAPTAGTPDVPAKGGEVIGCCALLPCDDGCNAPYGEVKALFTAEAARGRGVGAALLDRVEAEARARGLDRLCLETGDLLHAARRLYRRLGYVECPPFGDYDDDPRSVFMQKALSQTGDACERDGTA